MKLDLKSAEVRVPPGGSLFVQPFLAGAEPDDVSVPSRSSLSLARFVHGLLRMERFDAPNTEPRLVEVLAHRELCRFQVVELAEGERLGVNLSHLVGWTNSVRIGVSWRLLPFGLLLAGWGRLPVFTGPGTLLLYGGHEFHEVEVDGPGASLYPGRVAAWGPEVTLTPSLLPSTGHPLKVAFRLFASPIRLTPAGRGRLIRLGVETGGPTAAGSRGLLGVLFDGLFRFLRGLAN